MPDSGDRETNQTTGEQLAAPSNWPSAPAGWSLPRADHGAWDDALPRPSAPPPPLQAAWQEAALAPQAWRLETHEPVWDFLNKGEPDAAQAPEPQVEPPGPTGEPTEVFDPLAQYPGPLACEGEVLEDLIDELQVAGEPAPQDDGNVPFVDSIPVQEAAPETVHVSPVSDNPGEAPPLELPWEASGAQTQFLPVIDVPAQTVADAPGHEENQNIPPALQASVVAPRRHFFRPPSAVILAGGSVVAAAALVLTFNPTPPQPAAHTLALRVEQLPRLPLLPAQRAAQRISQQHRDNARAVERALRCYVQAFGQFPPDAGALERAVDRLGYRLRNPYEPKKRLKLAWGNYPRSPGIVAVQQQDGSYFIRVADRQGRCVSNGSYDWLVRGDVASLHAPSLGNFAANAPRVATVPWPKNVPWISPLWAPPMPKQPQVAAPTAAQLAARQSARQRSQSLEFERWRRQGVALAYQGKFAQAKGCFVRALTLRPSEASVVGWLQLLEPHAEAEHSAKSPIRAKIVQEALVRRERLIRQKMREMGSWEQGALVPPGVIEYSRTP